MDRLALETELKTEILNVVLDSNGDLKKMNLTNILNLSAKLNNFKNKSTKESNFNKMSERDVFDFESEQEEIRERMNRLRS